MLVHILVHTPLYVWGLLAALVLLGLLQMRTRQVSKGQLLALPLVLLGLGLWSLIPGIAAMPLVALCWLVALGLSAALGRRIPVQPGTAWLASVRRLQLPGSWLPMVLIMLIFSLRYAMGVGTAMHPEWRTMLQVQAPLALALGVLAGLSLGRTLGLLSLAQPAQATIPAHVSSRLA